MTDKKTIFGLIAVATVLVLTMVYLPLPAGFAGAQSETETELRGWAWSNNVGWVSFNTSDYSDATANYKVVMDADGKLSGYAWSLNLGWIKFSPELYDSANCGSTGDCYGAKLVEGSPNQLKGWARVCSVYISGCSGSLRSSAELGGWNGWIRMYNVTQDSNGGFLGYAWGDLNMGWLKLGLNTQSGGGDPTTECPVPLVDGDCCPAWQVCGGGSVDNPEEESEVTITAQGCDSEMGVFFNPEGGECDLPGDSCRSYSLGEDVEVSFSGEVLPLSVSGCPNYGVDNGVCSIEGIDRNYNLIAICNATDISACEPRLTTSPTPLRLSERNLVSYPAFSNNAIGKLDLVDVSSGRSCYGLSYDLKTEEFKYLTAGGHESFDDSTVSIVCQGGDGSYSVGDCNGLTGGTVINVKAYFGSRPINKSTTWHLQMTATEVGSGAPSQTYGAGANNQLVQYSRSSGNK